MTIPRKALAGAATAVALGAGMLLAGPAAAADAPSTTTKTCAKAPWQASVQGAPTGLGAGSPSGDYLWHSRTGFHLRVTHAHHEKRVYTGRITSSASLHMAPVKLEKGDSVRLSKNHRTIVFSFANHGYIDGINFRTDCASALVVTGLRVGSSNLPKSRIYLGTTKAHPAHSTFVVHRARTHA